MCASLAVHVLGNQLYLAAGVTSYTCTQVLTNTQSNTLPLKKKLIESVLTCSLSDLLPPQSPDTRLRTPSSANQRGVWQSMPDLPVTWSTLVTLGGHLLADGGRTCRYSVCPDEDVCKLFEYYKPTTDVYRYDFSSSSWRLSGSSKFSNDSLLTLFQVAFSFPIAFSEALSSK